MSYQTDPRKIFCASDLHIGYEKSNIGTIYKFLDIASKKADELILCGDVFDMWRYPITDINKDTPMSKRIIDISKSINNIAKNIPTTIIWGNHDYQLGKNIDKYRDIFSNIRITDEFFYGNMYFCHGWRFDYQQLLGSIFYSFLINRFPYIYQKLFKTPSYITK